MDAQREIEKKERPKDREREWSPAAGGNKILADVGPWLKDTITARFKTLGLPLTIKYIDPTYMHLGSKGCATENAMALPGTTTCKPLHVAVPVKQGWAPMPAAKIVVYSLALLLYHLLQRRSPLGFVRCRRTLMTAPTAPCWGRWRCTGPWRATAASRSLGCEWSRPYPGQGHQFRGISTHLI